MSEAVSGLEQRASQFRVRFRQRPHQQGYRRTPWGCVCVPVSGGGAHRGLGAAVTLPEQVDAGYLPPPSMVAASPLENLTALRPTLRPDENHACECPARGGGEPHPGLPHSSSHLCSVSCSQRVSDLAHAPATDLRPPTPPFIRSPRGWAQSQIPFGSGPGLKCTTERKEDLIVFLKQTDENVWLQGRGSSVLSPAPSQL